MSCVSKYLDIIEFLLDFDSVFMILFKISNILFFFLFAGVEELFCIFST